MRAGVRKALEGKANSAHLHAIGDVSGLQAALDGKSASDHTHPGGGSSWGSITGTLADQTDLNTALSGKASTGHNHDASYVPLARAINNGYGIGGGGDLSANRTLAVGLTSAAAYATAETTISAATYADINGCSVSLAAGTWLVVGQVNIRQPNQIVQAFVAITDGANAVISEIAASRPASGTASLNSPFSCNPIAIVSPSGTTTYKLRGARGLTTHTGSWVAMDGNGVNTTNHASNNSDKGSGIFAVRIA